MPRLTKIGRRQKRLKVVVNRAFRGSAAIITVAAVVLSACSKPAESDRMSDVTYNGAQTSQSSTNGPAASTRTYPTTAQVLDSVKAARDIHDLPNAAAAALTKQDPAGAVHSFECRPVSNPSSADWFGQCAFGDPAGTKLMVMYGDSRASMWTAALEGVAAQNGWKLRAYGLGGCPAPDMQFMSNETNSPNHACDLFHDSAVAEITAQHPDLIIVTSGAGNRLIDGNFPSPAQWTDGWVSMLNKLGATGARLAMLGDIPVWPNDDARCLAAHSRDVQVCSTDAASGVPPTLDSEQAAATTAKALYVATVPWVCADRCEPVIGDKVVYFNQYHFTGSYAASLTGAVGAALAPLISQR
jgi:hypothetical protein